MGSANSNLTQSSEVGTLNWKNDNSENDLKKEFKTKKLDNGLEEIEIDINSLSDSQNSYQELNNVFEKIGEEISKSESEKNQDDSSPFISTELYKKIISGGGDEDTSSPFISSQTYNKILKGGLKLDDLSSSSSSSSMSDDKSTSSSLLLKALSEISITSSDYENYDKKKDFKKNHQMNYYSKKKTKQYGSSTSSKEVKGYNFSETSDINSNDNNYIGGNSSETPYNINSSSIKTSDINMVSVDSVNGRRFID